MSHHETERLLEIYKPRIFCAGIKEKYAVQKMGIPCKQLHSYDYGGPYAGLRRGDQLLPGDRPHGEHEDLVIAETAMADESEPQPEPAPTWQPTSSP